MPNLAFEAAIEYLQNGQDMLDVQPDFVANPELRSAVLQAILDASNLSFSERLVSQYNLSLSRKLYDEPSSELPFSSDLKTAQVLVYRKALMLNG